MCIVFTGSEPGSGPLTNKLDPHKCTATNDRYSHEVIGLSVNPPVALQETWDRVAHSIFL